MSWAIPVPIITEITESERDDIDNILKNMPTSCNSFLSTNSELFNLYAVFYNLQSSWNTNLGIMQINKVIDIFNKIYEYYNLILDDFGDIVEKANEIISDYEENHLSPWKTSMENSYRNNEEKEEFSWELIQSTYDFHHIDELNDYLADYNNNKVKKLDYCVLQNDPAHYWVHEDDAKRCINSIKAALEDFDTYFFDNVITYTSGRCFCNSEINDYFKNILECATEAQNLIVSSVSYLQNTTLNSISVDNAIEKVIEDKNGVWNYDDDVSSIVDEETYEQYEMYINEEERRKKDLIAFYVKFCSDGIINKNDQYNILRDRYGLTEKEMDSHLQKIIEGNGIIDFISHGILGRGIASGIITGITLAKDDQNSENKEDANSQEDLTEEGEKPTNDTKPATPSEGVSWSTKPETPPEENPGTTEPETPPEEDPGITEPETPPEEDPGITEPETPTEEDPGTTEPETPPEEDPGTTEPETPPEEDSGTTEPEIGGESDWSAVTDEEGNIPEPEVTTSEDTFTPPEETGDTTITEPNADGSEPILDQNGDVQQPEIDDTVSDEGDIVSPAPEEGEPVVSENDDVQMPKVGDTGAIEDDMVNPTLDEPNISEDKLVSPLLDDENAVISDATSDIAESTTDALNEATADADVAELNSNVLENDPSMENMMSSNDKDSSFDLELDNVDPLDVNPIEDDFDFNAMMEGIDDKIGFSRLDIPKPDGSIPVPKDPTIKDM